MMIMSTPTNLIDQLSLDITKTIQLVFSKNVYATKAIQTTLAHHPEWNELKRATFSETTYDIVRWWRPLWYILGQDPSFEEKDFQKLIFVYLFTKKGDISALQKKRGLDPNQIFQRISDTKHTRTLQESIPDWLDKQGECELGTRWDQVLKSLNQQPDSIIRVNTLKTTQKELITSLKKEGITAEPVPWCPDGLHLIEKTNVFRLPSFSKGFFEVQDASSQMVSRFLDPHPGMRVVDACAGEGSKTLHLAALMNNKGKIIALDTQEWRLKELRRRAKKAGVDTIETRWIDSSKVTKRLDGTADRLLLDVPCSGLGTLRRNPDIKWKLQAEDLKRLIILQQELLETYWTILKPKERMVYAVCSIFPSEGEEQVKRFLPNHQEFQLVQEKRYWPDTDKTDGFYMALLERTR
jgi:16S rRNA (cytosine967-C5)-methyltransferase